MIREYLATYPDQAILGSTLFLFIFWSDKENNVLKGKALIALIALAALFVARRASAQASLSYALFLITHLALLKPILAASQRQIELRLYSIIWALSGHLMIEAQDWMMLFLGGELFSLPLYAWFALRPAPGALLSATRYFLQSALLSAFFVIGLALFYGQTHSLNFAPWDQGLWADLFWVLVLGWFFFKLAVAPFGFWVSEIYEILQPVEIVWLSLVPKYALLGALAQVAAVSWGPESWLTAQKIILAMIVLTSLWGHSASWVQRRWAQFLAYSGQAQAGLVLAPLLLGSSGLGLSLAAQTVYALSLALFFASSNKESVCYRLGLLSLSALPPTPFFAIKIAIVWFLLQSGYATLAFFLILMGVVSLSYYLRLYSENLVASQATFSSKEA